MAMCPCVHLIVCFIVRVRVHMCVSPCMCWREPVYVGPYARMYASLRSLYSTQPHCHDGGIQTE